MISMESITKFIEQCRKDSWTHIEILTQIDLVCKGVRDIRLHDNCIILLDGQPAENIN